MTEEEGEKMYVAAFAAAPAGIRANLFFVGIQVAGMYIGRRFHFEQPS